MGYCISLRASNFKIKKENKALALEALKKLGNGKDDERSQGGSSDGRKWFSWMNDVDPTQWDSIKEAMSDWRYPVKLDSEGNVVGISFDGEKIGQEKLMFEAIAPFVEPNSFLHMAGEDGDQWLYDFNGITMIEKKGQVTFS